MAQDLVTLDPAGPADGPRGLASRALSLLTSTTDRVRAELGEEAGAAIAAAAAQVEHELRPVPAEPALRREWEAALDERLRRLAVKVAPTASPEQTVEWRRAMAEALSDLPAMIALTAARRAIHRPFRFVGDIEAAVREIAAELLDRREARLRGLRRMAAELDRAMRAPPALPANDPAAPIGAAQIRAMGPDLRRMGLAAGYLTKAEVAAAMADAGPAMEAAA